MTFHTYCLSRYPNWDTFPLNLRREYEPRLRRDFHLSHTAIGKAKVKYIALCKHRVQPPQVTFDIAVKCLRDEGVIK